MAWNVLSSLTAPSSGTFIFTGLSLTSVLRLQIVLSAVTVTTDGTDVKLTFYVDGSEITGTSYAWELKGQGSGGTDQVDSATGAAAFVLCSDNAGWDTGNASTKSYGGWIDVDTPGSTALYKRISSQMGHVAPNGTMISSPVSGIFANAGAIDGLKISGTSNLVAGHVRLLTLV